MPEEARTYSKTLVESDVTITGSLVTASAYEPLRWAQKSYQDSQMGRSETVKSFQHGMFQSVYDNPYLSSSANYLFSITAGIAPYVPSLTTETRGTLFQGAWSGSADFYNLCVSASSKPTTDKKVRIYEQMATQLVGRDPNGEIRFFPGDGNNSSEGDKLLDPIIINFSRHLVKDEITPGSFSMIIGTATPEKKFKKSLEILDDLTLSEDKIRLDSPAGKYGLLYYDRVGASGTNIYNAGRIQFAGRLPVGLIYYQAGVVVLDSTRLFSWHESVGGGQTDGRNPYGGKPIHFRGIGIGVPVVDGIRDFDMTWRRKAAEGAWAETQMSGTIADAADFLRDRIVNIKFKNKTEINSATYFCRAQHNEFNYSNNPTYLTGSEIRIKHGDRDETPKTYITSVVLYSADNVLLAIAKPSEVLPKDPDQEVTLRVRLDF